MINFDNLTNYVQEILSASSALTMSKKNTQIEPEHIMLAMIQDNGLSRDYLTELKPFCKSAIISSICSVPIERRIVFCFIPWSRSSSSVS